MNQNFQWLIQACMESVHEQGQCVDSALGQNLIGEAIWADRAQRSDELL